MITGAQQKEWSTELVRAVATARALQTKGAPCLSSNEGWRLDVRHELHNVGAGFAVLDEELDGLDHLPPNEAAAAIVRARRGDTTPATPAPAAPPKEKVAPVSKRWLRDLQEALATLGEKTKCSTAELAEVDVLLPHQAAAAIATKRAR